MPHPPDDDEGNNPLTLHHQTLCQIEQQVHEAEGKDASNMQVSFKGGFDNVVFFGRNGRRMSKLFELDELSIHYRAKCGYDLRVLDCPGGPSSLTHRLRKLGAKPTALDPMYPLSAPSESDLDRLRDLADRDMRIVRDKVAAATKKPVDFEKLMVVQRLQALDPFLEDIEKHPESYVKGSLPSLPFENDSFDVACCGHLLFAYSPPPHGVLLGSRMDLEWHRRAVLELLRVAKDVRIYPINSFEMHVFEERREFELHPYVNPLIRSLPRSLRFTLYTPEETESEPLEDEWSPIARSGVQGLKIERVPYDPGDHHKHD